MNQDLPQVKTVKLLFIDIDEQQQAMFKMAFKMHSTTNYQVVDTASGQQPELVIVDGDKPSSLAAWQSARANYPNSIIIYFSKNPPPITAPYLAKPIKFDTLFVNLRNLLQGNGVWVVQQNSSLSQAPVSGSRHTGVSDNVAPSHHAVKATEISIPRFDPNVGLLGAFRKVVAQQKDTAIWVDDKQVLAIFPAIQRVWVSVDSAQLQQLCRQEDLNISLKSIDDTVSQERANATITSTLWQMALWTAHGRLVQPINPNTVFRLQNWPNLTRLAPLPESMRLSAFLVKTPVNLNMLYKMMPLDMSDILNYLAATYLTDYLEITQQVQETVAQPATVRVDESKPQSKPQAEQAETSRPQSGGLLSRLMKKLLNK